MELDLENQFADRAYALLASLVTPRPIAFVTTISPDGKVNAAPFSFFNLMGAKPPILAVAPGDRDQQLHIRVYTDARNVSCGHGHWQRIFPTLLRKLRADLTYYVLPDANMDWDRGSFFLDFLSLDSSRHSPFATSDPSDL